MISLIQAYAGHIIDFWKYIFVAVIGSFGGAIAQYFLNKKSNEAKVEKDEAETKALNLSSLAKITESYKQAMIEFSNKANEHAKETEECNKKYKDLSHKYTLISAKCDIMNVEYIALSERLNNIVALIKNAVRNNDNNLLKQLADEL